MLEVDELVGVDRREVFEVRAATLVVAIATIVGTEIVLVLLASALLSSGLTWAGLALIRSQLA